MLRSGATIAETSSTTYQSKRVGKRRCSPSKKSPPGWRP